ncbi:acetyl-CoA C-acetyltransferase [Carboxylicivirga sp. M1479]|uniref:acetyl-CoA C-acetyltransferase n=1 Tax=Carboxylicivirga sp. M1479 TaxID=2594476 RepID=UPI0011778B21|nr:acetyl-CoA C-acetyltransferase [Carboxylicivirga sp. M1479]TRX71848.1 acetyl-CoA C-acetyltransferase [Carboxylicivirga sp. M1479]
MKEIYIIDAARTAIGNFGGSLSTISPATMGATVVKTLLERNKLNGSEVDEVLMGSVLQAGHGQNVARQIAMEAGIPKEKTAMTINMVCGSGLRTVAMAAQAIKAGDAELIIAGGAENMSQAPYILPKARNGYRMGDGTLVDTMIADGLTDVFNNYHMGITAENLADKFNLSREEQDAFAADSQNKAEKAINEGRFENEIVPVEIPQRRKDPIIFKQDEFVRFGVTAESLAKLRPAFKKDGSVTAANASGINDGAAAIIVASKEAVEKYGLKPMAKIVSYAWHGTEPCIMGIGPVEAVRSALKKADWNKDELELIEANEAFAAQSLSVMKELELKPEICNVNGGAIAIGHPIGASGTRILTTLVHEMKKREVNKGLATLCIGGGMGIAMCVERI